MISRRVSSKLTKITRNLNRRQGLVNQDVYFVFQVSSLLLCSQVRNLNVNLERHSADRLESERQVLKFAFMSRCIV